MTRSGSGGCLLQQMQCVCAWFFKWMWCCLILFFFHPTEAYDLFKAKRSYYKGLHIKERRCLSRSVHFITNRRLVAFEVKEEPPLILWEKKTNYRHRPGRTELAWANVLRLARFFLSLVQLKHEVFGNKKLIWFEGKVHETHLLRPQTGLFVRVAALRTDSATSWSWWKLSHSVALVLI